MPHLLPIERGILETIYIKLSKKAPPQAGPSTAEKVSANKYGGKSRNIIEFYKKFYKNSPFVRIKKKGIPAIKGCSVYQLLRYRD